MRGHGPGFPGMAGMFGHGGIGLGLVGIGLAIAADIIEDHQEEKAAETAARQKSENWVICSRCGRKFNYTAEGGSYSPATRTYACTTCARHMAEEAANARWTCSHCGAPAKGYACEYCGSPREGTASASGARANAYAGAASTTARRSGTAWNCTCGKTGCTGNFCTRCGRGR